MNTESATLLDWLTEPTVADKRANCGKLTQITVYSNGTVSVKAFYCHRYDCSRCAGVRKNEIKSMIMKYRPFWYVKTIGEEELAAVKKKVARAGEKYCAVGTGDNILILTLKPVLDEAKITGMGQLENLIVEHLDCEYDYRKRRFRHSNGLFPPKGKPTSLVHIKRRYATIESLHSVVERFISEGYYQKISGQEYYLTPFISKRKAEEVLSASARNLVWSES